jgi:hypothetical protein
MGIIHASAPRVEAWHEKNIQSNLMQNEVSQGFFPLRKKA